MVACAGSNSSSSALRASEQAAAPAAQQQQQQAEEEEEVPDTLWAANLLFLRHPSAAVPAASIMAVTAARLHSAQPLTLADAAVAGGVVALWLVQEWVVHKWLLHSSWEWFGREIHRGHHARPYHHVSLDPPALVLGVMALAAAVFAALLQPQHSPLWLTATGAYWTAGLFYEYSHYLVHTRVPSGSSTWLRAVRRHHMLHHMRNEDNWLSFSLPAVDAVFGTLPASGTSVPLTDMARLAHQCQPGAASRARSSSSSSATTAPPSAAAAAAPAQQQEQHAPSAMARR